jgi:hypothetical protein
MYLSMSVMIFCISFSNAQSWNTLGSGTNSEVQTFTIFNGNLIAGGGFDTAGGVPVDYVAQWNGHSWDSVGTNDVLGINAVSTYDSELYAADVFPSGPPLEGWNDTLWTAVNVPPFGWPQYFWALLVYNGKLYAGGQYYPVNNICSWDNVSYDTLLGGTNGPVYSLCEFNGNLYVGGSFDSAGRMPATNIAVWNGAIWNNTGKGINGPVYALTVFNNDLYAGGAFDSAGGMPAKNIAVWNGSNWVPVGLGVSNSLYALTAYGSVLVAGGIFDTAGGIVCNKIAQWNGSTWSALDGGVTGSSINALYNDNGSLYVGGEFNEAGNINANNIAKWSSPLGVIELKVNNAYVKVFPNPSTGSFTLSLTGITEKCSVEIYNVMGERVLTQILPPQTPKGALIAVNIAAQPDGIYLYRVIKEDGSLVGSGKVLIAH